MRTSYIGIIIIALAFSGLAAQEDSTAHAISRVGLTGIDELAKTISDPVVRIEEKEEAVRRLGELAKQLYVRKDIPASRLYNPILGVMSPQENVRHHHILRIAACEALAEFANADGSAALLDSLGKVLSNLNEHEEVRLAAARSLGRFQKDGAQATDQLVAALTKEVERGPTSNNVTVTTAIVKGLSNLRDRRSFVPLMRVIQSGFPTYTKKEAQKALENIKWD